ncbi:MAG TPA: PadR family transcriptional regulator [Symbiobacteriaceae bacterium]|nr:PadR family transcriptional regulator [Symbiobacteriaceae bacterium]
MEAWDTQLRKGGLELAVLLLLSRHRMYGLELLSSLTDAGFTVSEGTIYPLLSRLSGQGAITADWVTGDTGHPRKYYRLTGAGLEQTARMVSQWSEFAASMGRLILSTRFAPGKEAQA